VLQAIAHKLCRDSGRFLVPRRNNGVSERVGVVFPTLAPINLPGRFGLFLEAVLQSLVKKIFHPSNNADLSEAPMPSGRRERFASIGGMLGDVHEKYGFTNQVPLEQARALFADVPAEQLARYSNEQLQEMAFTAEVLARQFKTTETVESVTKKYALSFVAEDSAKD